MELSRRTGIPVDRVLAQARLRGYYPEEHFMDLFRICTSVVIKYDIDRIPKADKE